MPISIPNIIYIIFLGFISGFVAGRIYKKSGMLLGGTLIALQLFMCIGALMVGAHLSKEINHVILVHCIELLPCIFGGYFGENIKLTNERGYAFKKILWGIGWILTALFLWHGICGNPLTELALIRHAQITPGFITETWEDVDNDDHGRVHWHHGFIYTYTFSDGRQFTKRSGSWFGPLPRELRDLQQPYAIEVEYLPDDPSKSRIKGTGSDSIGDWLWRKMGLGSFLLFLSLAPGVGILRNGIRALRHPKELQESE